MSMTKCPYCAEEIQAEAIRCKHCHTWLSGDPDVGPGVQPVYASTPGVVSRLRRSSTDVMVAGLCGGLGRYLGIDSTAIRVVVALATFFTAIAPGILLYVILIFLIPRDDDPAAF